MEKSNFNKFPTILVEGQSCIAGWETIQATLAGKLGSEKKTKVVIAVDTYHGVCTSELIQKLGQLFAEKAVFDTAPALACECTIDDLIQEYVTDDPVFGFVCPYSLADFFDQQKVHELQRQISQSVVSTLVVGIGASLMAPDADLLIYADMPRWEIQLRLRQDQLSNLGAANGSAPFAHKYKRAFYVDWKVLDRHKKTLMNRWDYVLDTTQPSNPKLITGATFQKAMEATLRRPFRLVPFFDPGPWGGQWLKEVCDLDRSAVNYAWGFDCVPEENSLLFSINGQTVEVPALDLVFAHPVDLLGEEVFAAFSDEFPIRFDFLDTMGGGNLSLQVHPRQKYIQEKFGMPYTQNESYYFLDTKEDACVYLGLQETVKPIDMVHDLTKAERGDAAFEVDTYVAKWPVKKHSHALIPAGTVHCSGANSVVLEISATPFNFTFKLWDWGRVGLDGQPRPISLEHGVNNIRWDYTAPWVKAHLLDQSITVATGDGWREERTGLEEGSFIETRRHWFTKKVTHHTGGVVNVLNLIEGAEAIIESPTGAFDPYVVHYVETFIVPAIVGTYTIRPYGKSEGKEIGTIKAYIRTENLHPHQFVLS